MHLVERYATSCGIKINRPEIYQKYLPIPYNKYIVFYPQNIKSGAEYDHWQIVISSIFQFLASENIYIIQIGNKDSKKYINCAFIDEASIDFQNLSYIIKNAELVFGVDGINNHIASSFNKKMVALYYNINLQNVKPYWGDKSNQKLLYPKTSTKPFYGSNKTHKSINSINPEEVSKSVLDLLKVKYPQMINTLFIGNNFNNRTLDVIPDGPINIEILKDTSSLIVRMDLCFDEAILNNLLSHKKCVLITKKPINPQLIANYKQNILQIVYILDKHNDLNFIKFIKSNNIQYTLISEEPEEVINSFKLKYMDYGLIFKKNKNEKNFELPKNKQVFFRCAKVYFSSKGVFNGKYAWLNNLQNSQDVTDDQAFWEDLQDFHIFTIDNF
jgi:hypothetical protein